MKIKLSIRYWYKNAEIGELKGFVTVLLAEKESLESELNQSEKKRRKLNNRYKDLKKRTKGFKATQNS